MSSDRRPAPRKVRGVINGEQIDVRWKGKPVLLACQAYVLGPIEVVGLFGKKAKQARAKHAME